MAAYQGPDLCGDDLAAFRAHVDGLIETQNRRTDAQFAAQTAHFDKQIAMLQNRVDPMHEYFSVAKTNLAIMKWLVAVGGGVVAVWHFARDWFR